jgi:hypoxanthine phosphoribosyltransferase
MKKRSATTPGKRSARAGPGNSLRVVFTEQQIQKRVRELARQIDRDYQGKTLHVIGMLGNCYMFLADLVRAIRVPLTYHTIRPEIRDSAVGGTAVREIEYTPKVETTGKEVLLVDGILHSGLTLDHVCRYILGQNPKSLRTATLVEKTDERKVFVSTDYVGFKATGKFLVGYGMGYEEKYRNLPYIAQFGKRAPERSTESYLSHLIEEGRKEGREGQAS